MSKEVKVTDKNFNPEKTLHIYTRVSTRVQKEEGSSLKIQLDTGIKRSKKLKMNYCIWDEGDSSSYTDFISDRPVLKKLLNRMKTGKVKHLYVYNTDRLSRKRSTWYIIRNSIEMNNVVLYIKDSEKLDSSDKMSKMIMGVMSEFTQMENELRRDRSREGKIEKFKQGVYVFGRIFGYDKRDGKLVEHKTETKVLKKIFRLYSQGKTIQEISHWLTEEKVRTMRGNVIWSHQQIWGMLHNRTYIGETQYTDTLTEKVYHGKCKRIIDDKLWFDVQQRLKMSFQISQQKRRQKNDYLLTGYLYCGCCSSLVRGRTNKKIHMNLYYCGRTENRWRDSRLEECDKQRSKSSNVQRLDNLVWETVLDTVENSSLLKQQFKDIMLGENYEKVENKEFTIQSLLFKKRKRKNSIRSQIMMIENRRLDLRKKFYSGVIDKDDFKEIGTDVEFKIDSLNSQMMEVEEDIERLSESSHWIDWISKYGNKVDKYRKLTSIRQKSEIIGKFVHSIYIDYDVERKQHNVKINVRVPMFDDKYVVTGTDDVGRKKSIIKKGKNTKEFYLSETKRGRKSKSKKKRLNDTTVSPTITGDTKYYTTKQFSHG